ncbi:hypothetical protein HYV82_01490 [Candidatus Woesearchaeota archaeon]|nr:hypothetical protein [Candidatus Woesearchaeota archaeon]
MAIFGPKIYVLFVNDPELSQGILSSSYSYIFPDLYLKRGQAYIEELMQSGKLSPNFLSAARELSELGRNTLFRGIRPSQLRILIETGNTKRSENVSDAEAEKLAKYGLNPERVMYASPYLDKGWEYAAKFNPSILVLYHKDRFEEVHDFDYLYMLKHGDFQSAIKGIVRFLW